MCAITIYSAPGELTSPQWAKAFAAGCPKQTKIETVPAGDAGSIALFGSPRFEAIVQKAKTGSFDWYYGDHGFFGRGRYYRCARNATMFDGLNGNDDPARFRSFGIPIKPWRKTGTHIVICPNSAAFMTRHGATNWISETLATLRKHTRRPLRMRWKKDAHRRPLAIDLRNAWAVVTFRSNAAVEAVLAGVPAFCTAPCAGLSMGSDDLSKIETPGMPDGREQWAARLANHQWTLEEMARGDLWRTIGR